MNNYQSKLTDSSRLLADILVSHIGNDKTRYDEMMQICFKDEYPVSMRAARVIALCTEKYPELFNPYIDIVLDLLPDSKVDGVKRSFLKMFSEMPQLPGEEQTGRLTDVAFTLASDRKQTVGVRYLSLNCLEKIIKEHPGLLNEFKSLLEFLRNEENPSLHRFVLRTLKQNRRNL